MEIRKKLKIEFSRMFGTSSNKDIQWPPTDNMLNACADISMWEVIAILDPFNEIKATIIDPWKKEYLVTVPVKLIKPKLKN